MNWRSAFSSAWRTLFARLNISVGDLQIYDKRIARDSAARDLLTKNIAQLYREKGAFAFYYGKTDVAIDAYSRAVDLDPERPDDREVLNVLLQIRKVAEQPHNSH